MISNHLSNPDIYFRTSPQILHTIQTSIIQHKISFHSTHKFFPIITFLLCGYQTIFCDMLQSTPQGTSGLAIPLNQSNPCRTYWFSLCNPHIYTIGGFCLQDSPGSEQGNCQQTAPQQLGEELICDVSWHIHQYGCVW